VTYFNYVLENRLDVVIALGNDVQCFAFLSLFYVRNNGRYWQVISTKIISVELGRGSY